jgi:uncharacterized RDD family membrane protein YckC
MRNFSARETEWLLELDGIELASFHRRALALIIDGCILSGVFTALFLVSMALFIAVRLGVDIAQGHAPPSFQQFITSAPFNLQTSEPGIIKIGDNEFIHLLNDIAVPILYFGILLWKGKGRTPGKRLMKIRVVSLMHRHLSFWHCVERALGYGAAALEGGFGFVQFFIHPYRRCAQDRLAETIVVTERGYQAMQQKLQHPLIPDTNAACDAPE